MCQNKSLDIQSVISTNPSIKILSQELLCDSDKYLIRGYIDMDGMANYKNIFFMKFKSFECECKIYNAEETANCTRVRELFECLRLHDI